MSGAVLLAVLAHPDDESFGPGSALARYAREGAEVHVCIATDGGAGACDPALLASSGCQTVAELRRQRLPPQAREETYGRGGRLRWSGAGYNAASFSGNSTRLTRDRTRICWRARLRRRWP